MALKLERKFVVLFQGDSTVKENKYTKLLEKESVKARIIPPLSFSFINEEKLLECLCNYDSYSGMIFTSTRAVTAVSLSLLKLNEIYVDQWKRKTNFSVGKATGDHAISVLNFDTHGADSGNSENLCELIIEMCSHIEKPLLFPCSCIRKDTIPTMLSEKNIPVEEVVCYETVPNAHFENVWQNLISEEGLPDILVFFSPSGVQSCINIIKNSYKKLILPKFIAIGPSTEKALSETGVLCKVAEKPSPESVMNIVKDMIDT